MLGRLRRSMTLLCAAGVGLIGAVLVAVSLAISETQLTDRGQALFLSSVNAVAFRMSTESIVEWTWLARMEADGGIWIHMEDNGAPMLFSTRGTDSPRRAPLIARAQALAAERHDVDVASRPHSALRNSQADFRMEAGGVSYRVSVTALRTETGHKSLTVLQDTTAERAAIHRQRLVYLGLLAAFTGLAFLFSWWFTGRAVRPIAASRQRQAEFVAAASHELRTPLAVIRTSAAALRRREENRFLDTIERECASTGRLVDDLLVLAGADAGVWRADIAPVELPPLLADCVDAFRGVAAEKGLTLSLVLPPTLPVIPGDEFRLRQLAAILLDNACFYTPPGGHIAVGGETTGKYVRITVVDDGPGIPPEQYDRAFERFYRLDKSHTQKEHYGLGLSIAREIVRLHRGRIRLSETAGGGLTVTASLPVMGL